MSTLENEIRKKNRLSKKLSKIQRLSWIKRRKRLVKKPQELKDCQFCGNFFYKNRKYSIRQWESKRFCSKKCSSYAQRNWEHFGNHDGENNPQWMGGKSFEPYGVDWTRSLKKSIRERDRYTCQICWEEPAVVIHHINYDKKNCNINNLITLCKSCHSKTNLNRKYWTETLYQSLKSRLDKGEKGVKI